MDSFYQLAFPDIAFNYSGDTKVRCPFPHTDHVTGEIFYDQTPSLSIDIEKGIHHCFACHRKGNELQFIQDFMHLSAENAIQLKTILSKATEDIVDWQKAVQILNNDPNKIKMLKEQYHFSEKAIKTLQLGIEGAGRGIAFPVFLFDQLVDVISYNPGQQPKYRKRPRSENGLIMPYDSWKESEKATVIVAGQKDLGIALSNDINAIAITGGEGEIPELFLNDFKDRTVFIVFDNDKAGQDGSKKLATALKPYTKLIRIVDLSSVCTEKGEDLWDFFVKYNKTKKDLIKLINDSEEFTQEDFQKEREKIYPTVSLTDALQAKYVRRVLRSNIQILATDETKFLMPTAYTAKKYKVLGKSENKNQLNEGEELYWTFSKKRPKELFYMIDSNLKEDTIKEYMLKLIKYPQEIGMSINVTSQIPVYKCSVTDLHEATELDARITEFTAYSIGKQLESGKKYKATYSMVQHPFQGNALYMIIYDIEESSDSVTNFVVDQEVKENLDIFKVDINLKDTVDKHVDKLRGIVNADYSGILLMLIDLWYHTPLQFDLRNQKQARAYLDMLIVAESRTGKSTTSMALQKLYELGTRIPLNGSNATIAGIIGGSQKTKNGFQTRAGIIPRSHRGAVIFEELAKMNNDIQKELTEIRSSYTASITRVSGTIHLPAYVRQLSLTNAKTKRAGARSISSYPNGIEVILDLVGQPEDIARYDVIAILPEKGAQNIDPYFKPPTPYPKEAYLDRIRWIWSRESHQVEISQEVYVHTINLANKANDIFYSYIKIFGTETYLKFLRLAIAIAGYVCSTDETYEKIIVKKEHVDLAKDIIVSLYDNDAFRLREFVELERQYIEVTDDDIKILEKLWNGASATLEHLERYATTTSSNLRNVSGKSQDDFSRTMNRLAQNYFVKFDGYDIVPTEKFRKAMKHINRKIDLTVVEI